MSFLHEKMFGRIYRNADGGGAPGGSAPPAAAAPPAGGAPGGAPPAVWTDGIQDQGLREWAVNKGYHKSAPHEVAPQILQHYHSLEKLFGADKAGNAVILPNWDAADEAGVAAQNAFFDRIGRPKEGKDYDLAAPQGVTLDPEIEKWSRDTFHKIGLTAKQATALSKEYQALEAAKAHAEQQADVQRFAAEDKALKTEWGAAYADKIAKASAAAKALGIKGEVIDALQSKAGYSDVMKMFSNIAEKLGEDKLITGDSTGGGAGKMTPAEAKAELDRLSRDKEWMAAFMDKSHPNHKAALERKAFLTSQEVAGQA